MRQFIFTRINTRVLNLCTAIVVVIFAGSVQAKTLSTNDKQFLADYEKVRAALAADNLAEAKQAAKGLGPPFEFSIWQSRTIAEARKAFARMSVHAVKVAADQPGYHVMHCPKLNKDWVQTSKEIANPYGGKDMLGCGEIRK